MSFGGPNLKGMTSEWRRRWTHAQTRGRTIERQATRLREALVRLCDGQGSAVEVDRSVRAIREQLALVERMAAEWRDNP
jgi:hypothetical protein